MIKVKKKTKITPKFKKAGCKSGIRKKKEKHPILSNLIKNKKKVIDIFCLIKRYFSYLAYKLMIFLLSSPF